MDLVRSVLQEAETVISGPKRQEYGPAESSAERCALIWSGILGVTVTAEQFCLCMAGLKLYREAHQHKRDNLVDAAGYVGLLAMLEGE